MKLLAVLLLLCLTGTSVVRGQVNNYLLLAQQASIEMKAEYDEEIEYWRAWLTIEADDMGYYFTDLVAQAIALSSTDAQGAAIMRCADLAAESSRNNIQYLDDEIRYAERAANQLHSSVYQQLIETNIKEYDAELLYYYHGYRMEDASYALWYGYSDRMFYAWIDILFDFFYIHDDLYDCLDEVVSLK